MTIVDDDLPLERRASAAIAAALRPRSMRMTTSTALSRLPINGLFNFGRLLRQELMERFQFLGVDEIYFELEIAK